MANKRKKSGSAGRAASAPATPAAREFSDTPLPPYDPNSTLADLKAWEATHEAENAAMEEWGRSQSTTWAKSMGKAEKQALSFYTGKNYRKLQDQIRKDALTPENEARVAHLDAALAKAKTSEAVVVYRGTLLPRGTRYRITGVRTEPNGLVVADAVLTQ